MAKDTARRISEIMESKVPLMMNSSLMLYLYNRNHAQLIKLSFLSETISDKRR